LQWEFIRVEDGWYIKNVQQHTYLGFEGDASDGKKVECVHREHLWHIWEEKGVPDGYRSVNTTKLCWSNYNINALYYRIFAPNTKQNLDLADHGNQADGTIVQLWTTWEGLHQVWVVKEGRQTFHPLKIKIFNSHGLHSLSKCLPESISLT